MEAKEMGNSDGKVLAVEEHEEPSSTPQPGVVVKALIPALGR